MLFHSMITSFFPKIHAELNKKRFKKFLLKSREIGAEEKFLEVWNIKTHNLSFEKQTGYESRSAWFFAKTANKINSKFN